MWLSGISAQQVLDPTSTTEGVGVGRQGKEWQQSFKTESFKNVHSKL